MMNIAKKIFFYLAIIGWVLSLMVHLFALSGVNIEDEYPYILLLHVGLFVVWLPAILTMRKRQKAKPIEKSFNPLHFLKSTLGDAPAWLMTIAIVGFFYATVSSMLLFHFSYEGVAGIENGKYILHEHGSLIKELTEEEYNMHKAKSTRTFSGIWLAFYGIAAVALYPYEKKKETVDDGYSKEYE